MENIKYHDQRPKLTVRLTTAQKDQLDKLVPDRTRNRVMSVVIDDVIKLLSRNPLAIGMLLTRSLEPAKWILTKPRCSNCGYEVDLTKFASTYEVDNE